MACNHCIKNLFKLINLLQQNSLNQCCLDDGCTKPYLGPTMNCICYNTRVITLYTKDGKIYTTTYFDDANISQSSSFFRVDKVHDDCVTLLILREENGNYTSTNQYITISLSCVCAVQCISDVVVENLCERR